MKIDRQRPAGADPSGDERRRIPRTRVVWAARLETAVGGFDCRVTNVSPGGARVRVSASIGVGQPVSLVAPRLGEFHGMVAWERDGVIGVQFSDRDLSEGRNRLASAADAVTSADVEAPAAPEPVATPAATAPSCDDDTPEPDVGSNTTPRLTDLAGLAARLRQIVPSPTSTASLSADPSPEPAAASSLGSGIAARKRAQRPVMAASVELKPVAAVAAAPISVDDRLRQAIAIIHPDINELIDPQSAVQLPRHEFANQLTDLVQEVAKRRNLPLSRPEQASVVQRIIDEMLGLGPLEPLLADETVTDILVNGYNNVFVERRGKLEKTDVTFTDDQHVFNIAVRIVTKVGRRIDDSNPLVDARLPDGSRVNIIVPPLAIKGPMISIRKFAKQKISLAVMARQNNLSAAMALVLKIAARSRLNILISGGTGSGKTTLLNAMSQMIDPDERIVTIEDAAELQLQLPHVGSLETRPPNLEGNGEITMRDLFRNSLRMRPDRIILGEIRAAEAFDMLQAMNTGHDGSLGTIHANDPRAALSRLENIIAVSGIDIPPRALRGQIVQALDMIVQVSRMRDGKRRITHITEVIRLEGEVYVTQDLFTFQFEDGGKPDGELKGKFVCSGLRPHFMTKADYFGLGKVLMQAISDPDNVSTAGIDMPVFGG